FTGARTFPKTFFGSNGTGIAHIAPSRTSVVLYRLDVPVVVFAISLASIFAGPIDGLAAGAERTFRWRPQLEVAPPEGFDGHAALGKEAGAHRAEDQQRRGDDRDRTSRCKRRIRSSQRRAGAHHVVHDRDTLAGSSRRERVRHSITAREHAIIVRRQELREPEVRPESPGKQLRHERSANQ